MHEETFDAHTAARRFWQQELLSREDRAVIVDDLLAQLSADAGAESRLGRRPGIGGDYLFLVRGRGVLEQLDSKGATLKLEASDARVTVKTGPLFGNALRDVTGTFDLAAHTSIDANALSSALNLIAETEAQPPLRQMATGSHVKFVGVGVLENRDGGKKLKVTPIRVELSE